MPSRRTIHLRDGIARRTREKIVHAALERFSADGYVAATLEAIAAQAGVAVQTVKFVFHTKAELLLEVIDPRAFWRLPGE